jgi:hypothetical protein
MSRGEGRSAAPKAPREVLVTPMNTAVTHRSLVGLVLGAGSLNGRLEAFPGNSHGGTTECWPKAAPGNLKQDLLVRRVKPADALRTCIMSATEIYNKPENKN